MKCDKCGKNEVSYYYKSNINGKVTEQHLCSECASKLGKEEDLFTDMDNMFEEMFTPFFGRRSLFRALSDFDDWGFRMPTMLMPRIEVQLTEEPQTKQKASDPEMQRQREIRSLRAQMHEAAENEDFEKAAEIRDRIRKLEEPAAEKKDGKTE